MTDEGPLHLMVKALARSPSPVANAPSTLKVIFFLALKVSAGRASCALAMSPLKICTAESGVALTNEIDFRARPIFTRIVWVSTIGAICTFL